MIQAVVSDFGGVLTRPLLEAFTKAHDGADVPLAAYGQALWTAAERDGVNPLFELEKGRIAEPEFLDRIGAELEPALGHRPEMHQFREIYFEALQPNEPMIALMRELKRDGYRMAMLTNNVREWEPLWRSMLPVDEIFETVIDSGFVGCRKPESRIYAITLERLGLPPEACLFVDDVQVNCEGAERAGIAAVHFRGNEQAIAEIRSLLSLRNVA